MGMSIAANKFRGVYAARCLSVEDAELARTINNANVLCLAARTGREIVGTVDRNDADEIKRAEELLERLVERALGMGGTCTGEHGIGQGKMKYLHDEHGEGALAAMRAVKRALDPLDIMNPGKIFTL